jgi:hypothetical protein
MPAFRSPDPVIVREHFLGRVRSLDQLNPADRCYAVRGWSARVGRFGVAMLRMFFDPPGAMQPVKNTGKGGLQRVSVGLAISLK